MILETRTFIINRGESNVTHYDAVIIIQARYLVTNIVTGISMRRSDNHTCVIYVTHSVQHCDARDLVTLSLVYRCDTQTITLP